MRNTVINEPKVEIACQPYFHVSDEGGMQQAGYRILFVLWDQADRPSSWFEENQRDILYKLDNLHIETDYKESFDLHDIDPRLESFREIDFAQLDNLGETCAAHFIVLDESYCWHLLFVRVDSGQYILNGGLFCTLEGEPPTRWQDLGAYERNNFFEVRVPIDSFRMTYAAAVDKLRKEKIQKHAYTPDSTSLKSFIHGEFS